MPRIIVAASAVLAVVLAEAHRRDIIEATRGAELLSPETLPFEVANALSARMKRSDIHRLEPSIAEAAFHAFLSMQIERIAVSRADHEAALALAGQLGAYVYDVYLLLAARSKRAALLTLDGMGRRQGLRQLADAIGVPVVF